MRHSGRFLRAVLIGAVLCAGLALTVTALTYSAGADSASLSKGVRATMPENQIPGWDKVDLKSTVSYAPADAVPVAALDETNPDPDASDAADDVSVPSPDSEPAASDADLGVATLNTDGASLTLRSGPGSDYSKLASIPASATLTLTGSENGWYKTTYNGVTGYVCGDYVVLSGSDASAANSGSDASDADLGTATLNTDGASLTLRSGPGSDYSKLASIPASATLTLTGSENGWYKTTYNGVTGYVCGDYVVLSGSAASAEAAAPATTAEPTAAAASDADLGTATLSTGGASLNLRSGPGNSYSKLASIPASATLTLTGSENGWYKTAYNGVTGYVCGDYVVLSGSAAPAEAAAPAAAAEPTAVATPAPTTTAPAATTTASTENTSAASDTSLGAQVVAYAKQFLGCSYVYGSAGPNSFDCSGFTSYVYQHFGYSLSRSAAGQYSNGTSIDQSQLQPGDLLVWRAYGSSNAATHVGIYIGNNQYIHASSTGGCVTINDMSYGSNVRCLVGVRRIVS